MLLQLEGPRRPIVLLELPHVSMRLYHQGIDIDDVAHVVAEILANHGWPASCIVSHSFGTFVASRICQLHPACVHALVRSSIPAVCGQILSYHL